MTSDQNEEQGLGPTSEALLFDQAQVGCRNSLNALMERHAKLVPYVVNRQNRCGLAYEEALQAGRHGLWRAIMGYDPARGWQFTTYAYKAIMRYVWAAVQRHLVTRRREVGVEVLALWYGCQGPDPAALWAWGEVEASLHDLVGRLPERLRAVVVARYGLAGEEPSTYVQIARQLGITHEWARQLELQGLIWLRQPAHSQELRGLLRRHSQAEYAWAEEVAHAWRRRWRRR
jgi:RNA polymerase sigma factor (sigma-70 family)